MTNCVFKECEPEICQAFSHTSEGYMQAINTEYQFQVTKMMTKSDEECEYIIEKKK